MQGLWDDVEVLQGVSKTNENTPTLARGVLHLCIQAIGTRTPKTCHHLRPKTMPPTLTPLRDRLDGRVPEIETAADAQVVRQGLDGRATEI